MPKLKRRQALRKDHIVPLAVGGLDTVENLTLACTKCNNEKGRGVCVDIFIENLDE